MRKVNIHQAKTTLSQLVEAAEAGEEIVIARAGRPAARLTSAHPTRKGIKLGTLKGMFKKISKDFDEPLPESILAGFLNNSIEP
ncbi:MAG TPA: type II toxin-antitoxin system prevent-host-death family antitoxin [Steroidobacteraceae bacterium]|nr:type II toxin-antitoxin system prevent-host-death family antitoxin [Steroidobacteraceae bacterium]